MKRLIPDTIVARTLLVLIFGLALSHAISLALYITDQSSAAMFRNGEQIGGRIATIDRLIRASAKTERQHLVDLVNGPRLLVTWTEQSAIGEQEVSDWQKGSLLQALGTHLNPDSRRNVRIKHLGMRQREDGAEEAMMVSLSLPDDSWLNFTVLVKKPESFWSIRFGLSMAVMLMAVALLSALVVHHLVRPLATFAHAAQRLGVDVGAPPLPESGPAEVRQAKRAFNEMQDRIRRFVEDRTQMIAAISHDLGTPITRMRLRAELVEDDDQRQKMLADLDDMEKMAFSALSFARDEAAHEPQAMVDLRTLLQRVCDNTSDTGYPVSLDIGDDVVPYDCRPVALRRALSNLVENAVKYGGEARVSLLEQAGAIVVRIEDNGPGIAEARREEAFKPFHRLEGSRNRETGGTGLGLTVARTIVRAHGGDLILSNLDGGGLRVEVMLPR